MKRKRPSSAAARLDLKWTPYKNGIMQAKVPAGFDTDQLFVNGQRQSHGPLSQLRPQGRASSTATAADAHRPGARDTLGRPAGGFIHAMHPAEWGGYALSASPARTPTATLTYEGGWQNNRRAAHAPPVSASWRTSSRNSTPPANGSSITRPRTLYFYPPPGVDLAKATVEGVAPAAPGRVPRHAGEAGPLRHASGD